MSIQQMEDIVSDPEDFLNDPDELIYEEVSEDEEEINFDDFVVVDEDSDFDGKLDGGEKDGENYSTSGRKRKTSSGSSVQSETSSGNRKSTSANSSDKKLHDCHGKRYSKGDDGGHGDSANCSDGKASGKNSKNDTDIPDQRNQRKSDKIQEDSKSEETKEGKSNEKTVSRSDEKKVCKTDEKVSKSEEKKVSKQEEKKVNKPQEKKVSKHEEKNVGKPEEKNVSKPGEKKLNKPEEKKVNAFEKNGGASKENQDDSQSTASLSTIQKQETVDSSNPKTKESVQKIPVVVSQYASSKDTFQNIIILTHPTYNSVLKKLKKCEGKVKVIKDETLTLDTLPDVIKRHMASIGNGALWLLVTGAFSISSEQCCSECINSGCMKPVSYLDYVGTRSTTVEKKVQLIDRCIDKTQHEIGTTGVVAVAPPLPIAVYELCGQNHAEIHHMVKDGGALTNQGGIQGFQSIYDIFCKEVINMSCSKLKLWMKPKEFEFYKKDDPSYVNTYSIFLRWFKTMTEFCKGVLALPYPKTAIEDWVSKPCKYDQVVVVGLTKYTALLQSLTEEMPVIYVDEALDMNEFGLEQFNNLKRSWTKRTCWIVMVGISELSWPFHGGSCLCSSSYCSNPIPAFITRNQLHGDPTFKHNTDRQMADIFAQSAFDFLAKASVNIGQGSTIIMAPPIPQIAVFADIGCFDNHDSLHVLFERDNKIPFFVGTISSWRNSTNQFNDKCLDLIMSDFPKNSVPLKLIQDYKARKQSPLTFITSKSNIDPNVIRRDWSKLVFQLIDYIIKLKSNSPMLTKPRNSSSSSATGSSMLNFVMKCGDLEKSVHQDRSLGANSNIPYAQFDSGAIPPAVVALPSLPTPAATTVVCSPASYPGTQTNVGAIPLAAGSLQSLPIPVADTTVCYATPYHSAPFHAGAHPYAGAVLSASMALPTLPISTAATNVSYSAPYHSSPQSNVGVLPLPSMPTPVANTTVCSPAPETIPLPTASGKISTSVKAQPIQPSSASVTTKLSTTKDECAAIVIQYVDCKMDVNQARDLLNQFGVVKELVWPTNKKGILGNLIRVTYGASIEAQVAGRILSYIQPFGKKSVVTVVGGTRCKIQLSKTDLPYLLNASEFMKNLGKKPKVPEGKVENQKEIKDNFKANVLDIPLPNALDIPLPKDKMEDKSKIDKDVGKGEGVIEVGVKYGGELVPVESVNKFFLGMGAMENGIVKEDEIIYYFETYSAVLKLLTDIRFPDGNVKVRIPKIEKDVIFLKSEVAEADKIFRSLYKRIMEPVEKMLKIEIKREINIYTFKTERCEMWYRCKEKEVCPGYHNKEDRRRCPLSYKYSPEMCEEMELEGDCVDKDCCSKAHSSCERLMHFSLYKKSLCKQKGAKDYCDVQKLCYQVHEGKPDMFYHDDWKPLYVKGLEKSFSYLRGAIMNLYKFPNLKCPRVLLITPSKDMANLLLHCIAEYVASCGLRVVRLDRIASISESAEVIITTSKVILPMLPLPMDGMLNSKIDLSRLKALIIDDGPTVFNNCVEIKPDAFHSFGRHSGVNVVVTAEELSHAEIEVAGRLFRMKFQSDLTELSSSKEESLEPSPSVLQKKSSDSGDDSNDSSSTSRTAVKDRTSLHSKRSSRSPKRSRSRSPHSSSRSRLPARYPSKSYDWSPNQSRLSSSPMSRETSYRRAGMDIDKNLQKTDRKDRGDRSSRHGGSPPGKRKSSETSRDQPKAKIQKSSDLGKRKDFNERKASILKEIEELKMEHDRELELFLDTPEMHPSYEDSYTYFVEKYKKDHPGKNDMAHCEKMWKIFWEATMKELLKEEYKNKFAGLRKTWESLTKIDDPEKQFEECERSPSPENVKTENIFTSHEEDIDLQGLLKLNPPVCESEDKMQVVGKTWMQTLNVLRDACGSLGSVSHLLHVLLQNLQDCGSDRSKIRELLLDGDSKFILKAASEEFKNLGSSNNKDSQKFTLASLEASKLLDYSSQEDVENRLDKFGNKGYPLARSKQDAEGSQFSDSLGDKILHSHKEGGKMYGVRAEGSHHRLGPSDKHSEGKVHPQLEPNIKKSSEELFLELDCLKDKLSVFERMDEFGVTGVVTSMLIKNMRSCWSDKAKLSEILKDTDTQSLLKQISLEAKHSAEKSLNAYAAEKFDKTCSVAKKLLDISKSFKSMTDMNLSSSPEASSNPSTARSKSSYSREVFADTSPLRDFPSSSSPAFANPSSQASFSNPSPPSRSKENPGMSQSSDNFRSGGQILSSSGNLVHSKLDQEIEPSLGRQGSSQEVSDTELDFSLLDEVCSRIGIFGVVAQTLLKRFHDYWADKAKINEMLVDKDNKALLDMITSKLNTMSKETNEETDVLKYHLAAFQIAKLQDYRKSSTPEENYFGVDIDKIAKMTYKKDPGFIIQYIKSALFIEGIDNPSDDDLRKVFEAVFKVHFSMSTS